MAATPAPPSRSSWRAQSGRIMHAETRNRAGELQIFSLTLSQLSYRGLASVVLAVTLRSLVDCRQMQSASSPACLR